jgi:hypothetical protein
VQVPEQGAVTGRPFTDPSNGEKYLFFGDINDAGTARSMAVYRLKDGAKGLWNPLGGGIELGGPRGIIITRGNFSEDAAITASQKNLDELIPPGE